MMKDYKSRGRRNSKNKKGSEEVQEAPQRGNTESNQMLNSLEVKDVPSQGETGPGGQERHSPAVPWALRGIWAKPLGNRAGDKDKATMGHLHTHPGTSSHCRQLL